MLQASAMQEQEVSRFTLYSPQELMLNDFNLKPLKLAVRLERWYSYFTTLFKYPV